MRSVRVCLLVLVAALGCGESVRDEDGWVECLSDLDCAEGQRCVASDEAPRDLEALQGGGAGIGGSSFCPPSACATTGCGPGQVCKSGSIVGCPSALACLDDCADPDAVACEPATVCRVSGFCEPIRCDDPEYTGCPTGMTCDPTAVQRPDLPFPYSLFGTDQYPHLDFDHGPVLTERQTAATHIGCIFLRCDESGGFDCAEGFRCDVASAPPTTTGCAGIPCGELGRCSGDEYICEPTSPQPRPSMVDAHGCATKNCEEGVVCPVSTECDFTRPGLGIGCAYIRCDEPGGSCPREDFKCDPDPAPVPSGQTAVPDSYGCVPEHCALDDYVCPVDMVCDPTNPLGTLAGCAPPKPPDPETGGTGGTGGTTNGGTGGTSGTSGAGAGAPSGGVSGSTGAGGTTSDPSTPGVCR